MSTAATPIKSTELSPSQILIIGKIQEVTSFENGGYTTEVVMPAADQYSMPAVVEIRSEKRLGNKDDEIRQVCQISGWPRKFNYKDKNTGQQRFGRRIEMALRPVD
jgi:hypothetical protein